MAALPAWLVMHALATLVSIGAYLQGGRRIGWLRWDVDHLVWIASHGYSAPGPVNPLLRDDNAKGSTAFFPLQPLLVRGVHLVIPSWTAAGLLVSGGATLVALACVWQVVSGDRGVRTADRTLLYLALSPLSVVLVAGYTEPVFLAFAAAAWLAARQNRYAVAGWLCAAATMTRHTGLVLVAALVVDNFVRSGWRPPTWRNSTLLVVPSALCFGLWSSYLRDAFGHWDAYRVAENLVWSRHMVLPLVALAVTVMSAVHSPTWPHTVTWLNELVATTLGIAGTWRLAVTRRWGEAVYVGGYALVLSTSSYWASTARATVLWWPLFAGLAALGLTRPWLHRLTLAVFVPTSVLATTYFLYGGWIG